MQQREITDPENIRWSCAQAYSTMESKTAKKATELSKTGNGKVTVICTWAGAA